MTPGCDRLRDIILVPVDIVAANQKSRAENKIATHRIQRTEEKKLKYFCVRCYVKRDKYYRNYSIIFWRKNQSVERVTLMRYGGKGQL